MKARRKGVDLRQRALITALLLLPGRALAKVDFDMAIRTGATFGTLTRAALVIEGEEVSELALKYGGFPIGIGVNLDVSPALTLGTEIHFVADFTNSQLTEKGLNFSLQYHLFGGPRRLSFDYSPTLEMTRSDSMNLSLIGRLSYSLYDTSAPDGTDKINGASFDFHLGLQYRFDIGESSALALEGTTTFISMPATTPRVQCSRMEIGLLYRFFL